MCLRHVDFITYLLLCIHLSYELEVLYMLFETYFSFYRKKLHLSVFALNLHHQLLYRPSTLQFDSNKVQRSCSQNLCEIGDNFQRPRLTSLKMQLRGWGNFQQCPAAWRLSAFFCGKSRSRWRRVGERRQSPSAGSWGAHDGEVEVVTYSCQLRVLCTFPMPWI